MTPPLRSRALWVRVLATTLAATSSLVVLGASPASAYWTVTSTAGSSGGSAAATVGRGATPSLLASGHDVTISWAPATVSTGQAVDGYEVHRYDQSGLVDKGAVPGCSGLQTTTWCTALDLPAGTWVFSDTPLLSTYWRGAESPKSGPATISRTPPVNVITAASSNGSIFQSGDTVYYRGSAAGELSLTNALTATNASPLSSSTAVLGGATTGWTHTPSRVTTPTGGPFVSSPFSWTAGTDVTTTEHVTGRDTAGNSATTTITFVDDSAPPGRGTISYLDGLQPRHSVSITLTTGTDPGSGIATRQIERASAPLTGTGCGAFGPFTDRGPDTPSTPFVDTAVVSGTCYSYRYVVTDRVGNRDTATTTSVAQIGSAVGAPPLGVDSSISVLGGTGVVSGGSTVVSGDLGVSPSAAITGFPPGIVAGSTHANDDLAQQAQVDRAKAYAYAQTRIAKGEFAGTQNGVTFTPGVWHSAGAFELTGSMTLDGKDDPDAVFIFQVDAAFSPAANSAMVLTNGAKAANVYWQINGAVSTGASSSLAGTLLVNGAATLGDQSIWIGRVLASGTVTLSNNAVRFTDAPPPTLSIDGGPTARTKDPTPLIAGRTSVPTGTPVKVSIADQVLSTVVKADGSWSVKASTLTAGTYVITASARDPAGNAGNATQTLIDAINPLPVDLGRAASYSVLAGTDVTSSGATHLRGDLGLSLSGAIVGLPAASVDGRTDDKNDAAAGAQTDAMTAYSDLAGRAPLQQIAGDLVGRTFQDGVYHAAGAITLTGILTLDAENVPDARFVFQIAGALSPAAGSSIQLINGAQASNVFWVAAGAVSTDSHVRWQGTLLSLGAVTLGQGSSLAGQALAKGSVLLADNQLTDVTGHPPTVVPAPVVPPPVLSASIVRAPVLATARSTAPVHRTAVGTAPVSQTEVSAAPVGQTGVARAPVVPAPVAGTAAGLVAVLSVAVVRPDSGAAPPLPACTAPSGARPHGVSFVPTTALRSTDHPPVSTRTCAAPAP